MKRLSFVLLIAASLILSGCGAAATPAPQSAPMVEAGAAVAASSASSTIQ